MLAADAQQQAAQERGVFEVSQHELRERLNKTDAALELQQQQDKGWRFRQLEFMTRMMQTLDNLESRSRTLDANCTSFTAAVQQQGQEQQDGLAQQLDNLVSCQTNCETIEAAGSRINRAVVQLQQQWVAKQQKLQASDKGIQVRSAFGTRESTIIQTCLQPEGCERAGD